METLFASLYYLVPMYVITLTFYLLQSVHSIELEDTDQVQRAKGGYPHELYLL